MSCIILRGSFLEVSYAAVVEINQTGELCVLRVADLALEFVDARNPNYSKDISLTHLSLKGFAKRSQIFLAVEALDARLSRETPAHRLYQALVFQISCELIRNSDYLAFALEGVQGIDVHDDGMARILGRRRDTGACWPMNAPENLLEIVGRGHGRRGILSSAD